MDHSAAAVSRRYADLADALRRAVLSSPARLDAATRAAAVTGAGLPEPLGSYAAKVRDAPATVTDGDVGDLVAAGHTEDEIFEVTVAAAVGAALHSLDAGLRAFEDGV